LQRRHCFSSLRPLFPSVISSITPLFFFFFKKKLSSPLYALCFVFSFSLLFRFLYSPSPLFSSPCVAQFFPFSALFRFLHFPSPCFFFLFISFFLAPLGFFSLVS
jgi:hypothetical protein